MRFQLKSVLAAGCLLTASALSAAAFEATTVQPSELREGPSRDFAPIVALPPGSIVEVLNCDRSWCEVGIEDYDGFLPRGVLDLGGSSVPLYSFPPQIAAPALWHGRYYSRDHFRHESRSRWRDRDNRRLYVLPPRVQPRPLPPPMIRPLRPGEPVRPGVVPGEPQRRDTQPTVPGEPQRRDIQPQPKLGQPKGPQPGDRVMPPPSQPPAQRVAPPPPAPQRVAPPPPAPQRVAPPPPAPQRVAPPPPAPQRVAPPPPAPQRATPPAEKPKQKEKGGNQ